MFKERDLVKTKGAEEWQQEDRLQHFFIETVKQLQYSRAEK